VADSALGLINAGPGEEVHLIKGQRGGFADVTVHRGMKSLPCDESLQGQRLALRCHWHSSEDDKNIRHYKWQADSNKDATNKLRHMRRIDRHDLMVDSFMNPFLYL
jgi:hypothetical protein